MKAILLAAGLGTRLKPFTDSKPKALAEINHHSLLERNIRYLYSFGIKDVIVNVHHFADMIEDEIRLNNGFGSNVSISDERGEVLETGGGLKKAAHFFENEDCFVVMNVDVLCNMNLGKMIEEHRQCRSIATLAVSRRNSSRGFLFNHSMELCGWINTATGERKISRADISPEIFAFSGIQVLSASFLRNIRFEGKFSLVDVYLDLAKSFIIKGYDHTGDIFIDVGKPESIAVAEKLFP